MIGEPAVREGRLEYVDSWLLGLIPVPPHEWGFLAPYWWPRKLRHSILPLAYAKAEELSRYYGIRYRVRLRPNGWVATPVPEEPPC